MALYIKKAIETLLRHKYHCVSFLNLMLHCLLLKERKTFSFVLILIAHFNSKYELKSIINYQIYKHGVFLPWCIFAWCIFAMISIFQFRFIAAYFTEFTTRNVYVLLANAVFSVSVILLSKGQSHQYSEWKLSKEQSYSIYQQGAD